MACSADSPVATATTLDPPPPPAAPTALGAVVVDHTRVDLAWTDASDSEDSFELERSADGGASWSTIATTGPDAVGHSDTSVAAETEYWYRVRACLLGQCSAYSNVATATTPVAPTPPAAPSGLVATPVSRSRINLAWSDNSDDHFHGRGRHFANAD